MAAASGGSSFPATPEPSDESAWEVTAAPHGGWADPQRAKAVRYADRTYIGYVAGGTGDVEVVAVNHGARTAVAPYVLHAALGGEGTADLHDNPGLLVRASDHKLMAFYCRHAGDTVYMRISTTSLDTDPDLANGFAAEVSLVSQIGSSVHDYPVVLQMADGVIWLFYRVFFGGTGELTYSKSSDNGTTWSTGVTLYKNVGFSTYWQVNGNDDERIDVLTMDANADEDTTTSLLHFYLDTTTGLRYKSDGTNIAAATPIGPSDVTTIDARGGGHVVFCLEYDAGGDPVAGYVTRNNSSPGVPIDFTVRRARWNGSSWALADIVFTDDFPPSGGTNDPGLAILPDDPSVAFRPLYVAGQWVMYRWTEVGGVWSGEAIDSTDDNIYPNHVRYADPALTVVWMDGSYDSYLVWDTGTTGWGA